MGISFGSQRRTDSLEIAVKVRNCIRGADWAGPVFAPSASFQVEVALGVAQLAASEAFLDAAQHADRSSCLNSFEMMAFFVHALLMYCTALKRPSIEKVAKSDIKSLLLVIPSYNFLALMPQI